MEMVMQLVVCHFVNWLEGTIFWHSILRGVPTHPRRTLIHLPHHLVCSLFEILDHGSVTLPNEFVHLVYSVVVLFSVLFPYSIVDPCIFWHWKVLPRRREDACNSWTPRICAWQELAFLFQWLLYRNPLLSFRRSMPVIHLYLLGRICEVLRAWRMT